MSTLENGDILVRPAEIGQLWSGKKELQVSIKLNEIQ